MSNNYTYIQDPLTFEVTYPVYNIFFNKYSENEIMEENSNTFDKIDVFVYISDEKDEIPYDYKIYNNYIKSIDMDDLNNNIYKLIFHDMNPEDPKEIFFTYLDSTNSNLLLEEDISLVIFSKYKYVNLKLDPVMYMNNGNYEIESLKIDYAKINLKGNVYLTSKILEVQTSLDINNDSDVDAQFSSVLNFDISNYVDIGILNTTSNIELKFHYNNKDEKQYPLSKIDIYKINIGGFDNGLNNVESVAINRFFNTNIVTMNIEDSLSKATHLKVDTANSFTINEYNRNYISRKNGSDLFIKNVGIIDISNVNILYKVNENAENKDGDITNINFITISNDQEQNIYPKVSILNSKFVIDSLYASNGITYDFIVSRCSEVKSILFSECNLVYNPLKALNMINEFSIINSVLEFDDRILELKNINHCYLNNVSVNANYIDVINVNEILVNDSIITANNDANTNKGISILNSENPNLKTISFSGSDIDLGVNRDLEIDFGIDSGVTTTFNYCNIKGRKITISNFLLSLSNNEITSRDVKIKNGENSSNTSNKFIFDIDFLFDITGTIKFKQLIFSTDTAINKDAVKLVFREDTEVSMELIGDDEFNLVNYLNISNSNAILDLSTETYVKTIKIRNEIESTNKLNFLFYDVNPDEVILEKVNNEFINEYKKEKLKTEGGIDYVTYTNIFK